ncbi:MAG: TIGR02594 family protein [Syntrophales bacterium]|nr:TIGR02594 family protein [Syntrophales bacterium]MDD5643162.1 TIGR02594 family protein [Syntrophales bacterium]
MATPPKFTDQQEKYQRLFDTLTINPEKIGAIDRMIERLLKNRRLYEVVASPLGIPWVGLGLIHGLEGGAGISRRLQDGARLPETDNPESTWQESASRILQNQGWHQWQDWSIPGLLFKLEEYNGWGYYYHRVNSPYLWSFSQHYNRGKYIRDGVWSAAAVSQQAGAAVILRRMLDRGLVSLEAGAAASPGPQPTAPLPRPATYTLKQGDTLGALAQRFHISLDRLIESNPQIDDPDLVHPGDRINLPPDAVPDPDKPEAETPPPLTAATACHTVRPQESLESIAADYGLTLAALIRLNPQLISPGNDLYVPQTVKPSPDIPTPAPDEQPRWLKIAAQEMQLMVRETPDPDTDNPRILAYHRSTCGQASSEEVPWCSAFVNWCIEQSELKGTRSARAVSWLRWGRPLAEPRPGCIVVLWRSNNPEEGHVGFYWGAEGDRILLLGGNQQNAVTIQGYARSKVRNQGFRWPEEG